MQTFTQKYTIIQLFEDVPEGTQFSFHDWPLHATVVDTFSINWNVLTMVEHLEKALAPHPQAVTVAEDDEFFGPEKQTHVVLLQKSDSLAELHCDVLELLEKGGLKLNDPHFAREGFLPHSTVQKHARLNKGDHVTFDTLAIIDMFPGSDPYQRRVIKKIKIGTAV